MGESGRCAASLRTRTRDLSKQSGVIGAEGEAMGVLDLRQLVICQTRSVGEPCALHDLEGTVDDGSHGVAILRVVLPGWCGRVIVPSCGSKTTSPWKAASSTIVSMTSPARPCRRLMVT